MRAFNGVAIASLTLGGTGGTTAQKNVTMAGGTMTLAGNVTYVATGNPLGSVISGGTIQMAATRTFTVNDSLHTSNPVDLTVGSVLSGAGGLTKAGTGTMLLSVNLPSRPDAVPLVVPTT